MREPVLKEFQGPSKYHRFRCQGVGFIAEGLGLAEQS